MFKLLPLVLFTATTILYGELPGLIHGIKYHDQNITGWVMSEKLDGVRAVWNGSELLSRQGNRFHPHPDFIKNFPPFPLDGELWTKRNDFETVASTVTDDNTSTRWLNLTYNIFEAPNAKGDFFKRIENVRQWFERHPNRNATIIKQIPVKSNNDLMQFLRKIEQLGGEGIMVKNPYLPYTAGRTANLLKVKSYDDMEGRVIGYRKGQGKFTGMIGSLHIELENGVRFYLGSGLTQEDRKNPPPIGSIITFKFYGWTESGKPRFASFMRIRNEP